VRYGAVEAPDPDPPTYRDWLPAPSVLPDGGDSYQPWVHVPPPADAPSWARTSIGRSLVAYQTDYVGLDVDDAAFALTYGDATVLRGPVDRETVREVIPDTPYEPAGTEAGYDVYARPDVERVVAVGPDAVVFGNGPTEFREYVRATVDAGRGDVARYYERDADLAALTDSAGTRRWAWLWPAGVGTSSTRTTSGRTPSGGRPPSTTTIRAPTTSRPGSSRRATTRRWARGQGVTQGGATGRAGGPVRGESRRRHGRGPGRHRRDAPDVGRHRGGRRGPHPRRPARHLARVRQSRRGPADDSPRRGRPGPDRLAVGRGAGSETDGPVAATADVGDRLDPGEELVVATADAEPGATVRLVYRVPDGNASTTLFDYDLL